MPDNDDVDTSSAPAVKWDYRKILSLITIEPFIACWWLPAAMTLAAIENMNLEKICREFASSDGLNKDICKLFVHKSNFDLDCMTPGNFSMNWNKINETYPNIYGISAGIQDNVTSFLCNSEDGVQRRLATINTIRNPLSQIGPLIVLWFAGPWSDRKNLRLPCMLVPYLGEAIGYFIVFVSAVFFDSPVELPAYGYRLIPSFTGAENLMIMAAFSYLTAISTEENRTFRFAVFQVVMTTIPIIGNLLAPTLIRTFDYAQLFGMVIPIHILGLIYFLRLKEPKQQQIDEKAEELDGHDNMAMDEMTQHAASSKTSNSSADHHQSTMDIVEDNVEKSKNACLEFFDLELAKKCIAIVYKKREHVLRPLLICLLAVHFLLIGIANGEGNINYFFQRKVLNWDADYFSYNLAFGIASATFGTILFIGLMGKILKIGDIFQALLSVILTIFSRVVYVTFQTTPGYVIGTFADFAGSVKLLIARSLISKVVQEDEIATTYSLMGVLEASAGFIFALVYSKLYLEFVESFPSVGYVLSIGILSLVFVDFCAVYKMLKIKESADAEKEKSKTEDSKL